MAMPTYNYTPADATILTRAALSVSRAARVLAGSFYRSAQWSSNPNYSACEVIRRVSAPAATTYTNHAVIMGGPVPYGAYSNLQIPSRLVDVANVAPLADRQDALDSAADILSGYACLQGVFHPTATTLRTLAGARSDHGFGWTMFALGAKPIGEAEFIAVCATDAEATADRSERGSSLTLLQRSLADRARAALAAQWLAEAADGQLSPLDRARRIYAAAHIDANSAANATFGADEHSEKLADYARAAAADSTGAEAWQRFRDANDATADEQDKQAGAQVHKDLARERAIEQGAGAAANDDEEGSARVESAETSAEYNARKAGGAAAPSAGMPKRTKAQREAAAAADAVAAASGAARAIGGRAASTTGEWSVQAITIQ